MDSGDTGGGAGFSFGGPAVRLGHAGHALSLVVWRPTRLHYPSRNMEIGVDLRFERT
jgi:hypothetical protein